jgi:hypothetical protein
MRDRMRLLRDAGWTVLAVRPGDSLPDLWQQAEGQGRHLRQRADTGA